MKLRLLPSDIPIHNRSAITKCIVEISSHLDPYASKELSETLTEGDAIEVEVEEKNTASALRNLRKLNIEYEFIE